MEVAPTRTYAHNAAARLQLLRRTWFGVGIAYGLGGHVGLSLGCLAIGAVGVLAGGRSMPILWRRLNPGLLVLAALGSGASLLPAPSTRAPLPPAGVAQLIARVEEVQYERPERAQSRLRVLSGARLDDAAQLPPDTRLLAGPFPLPEGARVKLLANVRPALPFRNPSPHPPLPAAHPSRGRAALASVAAYSWCSINRGTRACSTLAAASCGSGSGRVSPKTWRPSRPRCCWAIRTRSATRTTPAFAALASHTCSPSPGCT